MVNSIDDFYQRLNNQQHYLTAVENLVQAYPNPQALFDLLVVNHTSDRHERRLLKHFDKAHQSVQNPITNYRLSLASAVEKYWRDQLNEKHSVFHVQLEDENMLALSRFKQSVKVEVNGWQIIVGPVLEASKPMQLSRSSFSPTNIQVPLNWQGSRECSDTVHARFKWQIWGIHDPNQNYIQLGGRIVNADSIYQELLERYRSKSWFWRRLHKLPDKDEWLKSQRQFEKFDHYHGFKDEALQSKLLQDDQLQVELLKVLMPATETLQKQLNYIWHEQLNYPVIEFGKTGLDFENRKEFL